MAVAQGDYKEIYTQGYFNDRSEFPDQTAIFTNGFWYGLFAPESLGINLKSLSIVSAITLKVSVT